MKKNILTFFVLIIFEVAFFAKEIHANTPLIQTQYGFGVFVSATDPLQDLAKFKSDVDNSVSSHQQWIRTAIMSWEIALSGNSSGQITWNDQNLAVYDEAINYAYQKGLKIMVFVSGAPDWTSFWGNNYSFEDYQKVSINYWRFLAQRYKDKVDIWQVFNEANGIHYRYFTPLTSLTNDYLSQMNTLLASARQTIKQEDPTARITTNSLGWPINDQQEEKWLQYFDAIKDNLDEITLDLYPDNNTTEINKLGTRVSNAFNRYSKPVIIGEIGVKTCTSCWGGLGEEIQKSFLPMSINQLKTGSPSIIFTYQMRDRSTDLTSGEGTFGIKYNNGEQKIGYDAVMSAMKNLPGDFKQDNQVNILDLQYFLTNFLHPYTIFDYNKLVENFGK